MAKNSLKQFDKLIPEHQYNVFIYLNLYSDKAKEGPTFISSIREKKYPVSFTEQTYRVIGSWVKYGLLDDPQEGGKWKKFSILDLVWIKIIDKLREFGYPVRKIEKVRQALFYAPNAEVWYNLDFAIWQVSYQKKNINLIVYSDGKAYLGEDGEIDYMRHYEGVKDFILIDFISLIRNLSSTPIVTEANESSDLYLKEIALLRLIKEGNYSSVEVILKDGEIELLKASEKVDVNRRVADLYKEGDFQEINIQQTNGKVVSIKRTITKKI